MLKIGYNISNKHLGSNTHLENPERLNYCIRQLKKILPHLIISNITYSKNTLFEMILNVHTKEHLMNLINFVPKDYTCRNCNERKKSNQMSIVEYVNFTKICKTCYTFSKIPAEDSIYCYLDPDTYFTAHTLDIILDGVGVLKQLVDEIKLDTQNAFAIIRPPGHHCENKGSGFCILNNAMITAKYAQEVGYLKVFILDIDFHHGDGTQNLLLSNKNLSNIRFCSIHGYGHGVYPGSGSRESNTNDILNIPLMIDIYDDTTRQQFDDNHYLNIIKGEVNDFILKDMPNIIVISCGFDAHQNDTLQGLNLSNNAYKRIVAHLNTYTIPKIYVVEGGYNKYAISSSIFEMIDQIIDK